MNKAWRLTVRRQTGLSLLSTAFILAAVAAVVTLALRLGPHYVDFYTMQTLVEELPAARVHEMDKREIRESLEKRFRINNIRDVAVRDVIKVERSKGETTLLIKYEAREHLVYNIDVLLSFEKQYSFH